MLVFHAEIPSLGIAIRQSRRERKKVTLAGLLTSRDVLIKGYADRFAIGIWGSDLRKHTVDRFFVSIFFGGEYPCHLN